MSLDNIKNINEIKKDAIEEFVNFIKEQMPLDICSGTEACEEINSLYELFLFKNLKANRLKTNADKIRSLSDEELADFINTIASESMATISYGTQEYTEIWEDRKETIKYLKTEIEKENDKTPNRDTDYEGNPLTNADKIKNMTNRELAKFLSDISIGYSYEDGDYIEYKDGDYIELGGNRIVTDNNTDLDTAIEEWLETGMEKENTKPLNRDTDDYER